MGLPNVTTSKPQTISYPAPGARPYRHDDFAVDPHVVVLFGATGDLARRKLIPGLVFLDQSELAPNIEIVATSLEDMSTERVPDAGQGGDRRLRDAQAHQGPVGQVRRNGHLCAAERGPGRWPRLSRQPRLSLGPKSVGCTTSVPPKAAPAVITMLRDADLVERPAS